MHFFSSKRNLINTKTRWYPKCHTLSKSIAFLTTFRYISLIKLHPFCCLNNQPNLLNFNFKTEMEKMMKENEKSTWLHWTWCNLILLMTSAKLLLAANETRNDTSNQRQYWFSNKCVRGKQILKFFILKLSAKCIFNTN